MHSAVVVDLRTCSYQLDPGLLKHPSTDEFPPRKSPLFPAGDMVSLGYDGVALLSTKCRLDQATKVNKELLCGGSLRPPFDEFPSVEKLVNDLKSHTEKKDVTNARTILVHICCYGLEPDGLLGYFLVPLFVACGNVEIGLQILTRLDDPDERSWNALLDGYLHCGHFQAALKLLQDMHTNCVHPCKNSFMGLLKICAKLRSLERAQEVHAEIVKEGYETDLFVGSTLIDGYAKCGSLTNAREVLDELPVRNVISWNVLIAGYAAHGLIEEVQSCVESMEKESLSPDSMTYTFWVKGCISAKFISKGLEVHAGIVKEELESVSLVAHALVEMFTKFGMLLEAREVLDGLSIQGVVPWTSLMTGYAEYGLHSKVLSCFREMQLKGIDLDGIAYVCVLKACGSLAAADKGCEVHAEVVKAGFERDQYVGNALIDMYGKCGSLSEAQEVLNELLTHDVVSWTTLMSGYAENGMVEELLSCLEQMKWENVLPNSITYVYCLKACANIGALRQGMELHFEICMEGYENDSFVGSTLVDMYAKCGLLEEAQGAFDSLPAQNVVSSTVLVAAYAEYGLAEEAVKCVDQMHRSGLPLDDVLYVTCLKAIGSSNDVGKGQEFHTEIVKVGSESGIFVGNALVDMYAKCDLLNESLDVFAKLPSRDIVSWNTLVSNFAECALADEAVGCLNRMKVEGLKPDRITFTTALKACSSAGAIAFGLGLHAEIIEIGLERDQYVRNTLLDMYARCGLLEEAKGVFEHLPKQDVVDWNTVLTGLIECEHAEEVLAYLDLMKLAGVVGDAVTFVCILRACGNLVEIEKTREIHADILIEGFESGPRVGNTLIDTYGRCGLLAEAEAVFEELQHRDVVSWNILVAGYAEHDDWEAVCICLERMQQSGFSPSISTYISTLRVCCSSSSLWEGQQLHSELIVKGLESDPLLGNNLVSMYARCGSITEAQFIFDELQDMRDSLAWTALIAGFANHGLCDDVLEILDQMQLESFSPSASTIVCSLKGFSRGQLDWGRRVHLKIVKEGFEIDLIVGNTLVDMYVKCGSFTEAQQLLEQMPIRDVVSWNSLLAGLVQDGSYEDMQKVLEDMTSDGVCPDAVTLSCVLKVVSNTKFLDTGKNCHVEALRKGYEKDVFVGNCLIDMYTKCDAVEEAEEVFEKLVNKDVFSWNAMVLGYVHCGLKERALSLVEQMRQGGTLADAVTFACGLKACDSSKMVSELHMKAVFKGFENDTFLGNTLVDMYCKYGLLTDARDIFHELPFRDTVSWNTIIAGYSEQGLGEEALDAVQQMEMDGIQQDVYTFVSCLKTCGSIGATRKGQEQHSRIVKVASEELSFVQNSLVDMYGKLGNMVDALYVFDSLSERGLVAWNSILAGYACHGKIDLVSCLLNEMSKERVLPDEITLLLVLTICSHLGLVDKGWDYLKVLWGESGVNVRTRHFNCVIDLLSRAGRLDEAAVLLSGMQSHSDSVAWSTMLSGCRNWSDWGLGQEAFEILVYG